MYVNEEMDEFKHEGWKVMTGSGKEDQTSVHADRVGKKTSCNIWRPSAPEKVWSTSSKMSVQMGVRATLPYAWVWWFSFNYPGFHWQFSKPPPNLKCKKHIKSLHVLLINQLDNALFVWQWNICLCLPLYVRIHSTGRSELHLWYPLTFGKLWLHSLHVFHAKEWL